MDDDNSDDDDDDAKVHAALPGAKEQPAKRRVPAIAGTSWERMAPSHIVGTL